jgi:hypothetical protein
MHLAGSLPSSLRRMMSGLALAQPQKRTAQAQSKSSGLAQLAEERLSSQLGLWSSFAEESMSLDDFFQGSNAEFVLFASAIFQG